MSAVRRSRLASYLREEKLSRRFASQGRAGKTVQPDCALSKGLTTLRSPLSLRGKPPSRVLESSARAPSIPCRVSSSILEIFPAGGIIRSSPKSRNRADFQRFWITTQMLRRLRKLSGALLQDTRQCFTRQSGQELARGLCSTAPFITAAREHPARVATSRSTITGHHAPGGSALASKCSRQARRWHAGRESDSKPVGLSPERSSLSRVAIPQQLLRKSSRKPGAMAIHWLPPFWRKPPTCWRYGLEKYSPFS